MRRHKGAGETQTGKIEIVISLLFCFCCVLVATNQCCRESLFKFLLLTNKDSSHSLITGLQMGEKKSVQRAHRKKHWLFFSPLRTSPEVAFVSTVCWSGRTDHLYRGFVSNAPQEGLPARDLYSCDVFHELSPGTCHGNESKFTSGLIHRALCTLTSAAHPV